MEMLKLENIILNQPCESRENAIRRAGEILAASGYVGEKYIEGMLARDAAMSTAIGNLIAIPHGEKEYKPEIKHTGLCVITYPEAIDWGGSKVNIVIGIAARGEEHLDIIGNIVDHIDNEDDAKNFLRISDRKKILKMLCGGAA